MDTLKLGHIITGEQQRDAIHIAIAPVIAGQKLAPGDHVSFLQDGRVGECDAPAIGVIDPFLKKIVHAGDKVWLMLFPGTITGLRHEWNHPAFPESSKTEEPKTDDPKEESRKFLENIADQCGVSFERMISAIEEDDYIHMGENESYKDVIGTDYEAFCRHAQIYTGKPGIQPYPFSCSC